MAIIRRCLIPLLLFALSCGCTDYVVVGEGDDPGSQADDDTSGPPDDDTSDPDDDDEGDDDDSSVQDDTCEEQPWPDLAVTIDDDCVAPPTENIWDLVVTAASADYGTSYIHIGRTEDGNGDGAVDSADPMQVWAFTTDRLNVYAHDGSLLTSIAEDVNRAYATVGEAEAAHAGMEFFASFERPYEQLHRVGMFDEGGLRWLSILGSESADIPWLTDLEGDGNLELLLESKILDAHTGNLLATLEGMPENESGRLFAADLDLDGTREIIGTSTEGLDEVALFAPDGSRLATCRSEVLATEIGDNKGVAIGNLDGDPEGEFAVAGLGFVVICDSDGSPITESDLGVFEPGIIGLAQLDSDALPEILLSDRSGMMAFDADLTPLWTFQSPNHNGNNWYAFSVADLDQGGRHEVLVTDFDTLYVLDGDGDILASVAAPFPPSAGCSTCPPAIADIDADGLAEIVVPHWSVFAVVENLDGGWYVEGADEPWPGIDKHPGDRSPTGELPAPTDVHWADPLTNVWQGVRAGTSSLSPVSDLRVQDIDVCTDASAEALITAYVANYGLIGVHTDIIVFLSTANGTFLEDKILEPSIEAGTARAVQFTVPVADVAAGVEVAVDVLENISECDEDNNSTIGSL